MTNELLTTPQAAAKLGISAHALRNWIHRNPEYTPAAQIAHVHGWTEAEIEAVRDRRKELRKRPQAGKRRKKNQKGA